MQSRVYLPVIVQAFTIVLAEILSLIVQLVMRLREAVDDYSMHIVVANSPGCINRVFDSVLVDTSALKCSSYNRRIIYLASSVSVSYKLSDKLPIP